MVYFRLIFWPLFAITLAFGLLTTDHVANAAQLTLSWTDASDNEDGFGIERRSGTSAFQRIASVGSNVGTYTDPNLASSTTYCYRVNAFNTAGNSAYTNEICGTTLAASFTLNVGRSGTGIGTVTSSPAGINCGSDCTEVYAGGTAVTLTASPASGSTFAGWSGTACSNGTVTVNGDISCTAVFNLITTYSLTVNRLGTGSGTVTSNPAGINCGSSCSTTLSSGTAVTLSAIPASGSTFAGWTGNADCADGSVTVTSNMGCTATFNSSGYTLTTSVINEATSGGTSGGTIVSTPAGINCGSDCTENYTAGVIVTLTPKPAANSKFKAWTGHSDCTDGSVTLDANKTCTATFTLNTVSLSISKTGNGTVGSTPSGINCGTGCSFNFVAGTAVTLRATPDAGFTLSGWSGACTGTADCVVTLSSNTTVTANFANSLSDKIGIYRPSTGEWFLDRNGNGKWDDADTYAEPFGETVGVPVVGDWDGSGKTKLGLFVSKSSQWLLDCEVDNCVRSFGQSSDLPAVGRWTTIPGDSIGVFRPSEKKWHLDTNRNGVLDGCRQDECPSFSIYMDGDIPVAGDWTGSGTTQLGFFRPNTGEWFLNRNGNGKWDGCRKDTCITSFGEAGDLPVIGDWNGTGKSKIGVFRPSTGEWFLDSNGNGNWDDAIDLHLSYGAAGDVPVVGKW
jgi:hypothetical protein